MHRVFHGLGDSAASQILEFAVVVPLLVVLVVGIYDFGQAFSFRQKLTFTARDAARLGSSQPTTDLTQTAPISVAAIRDLVDADLITAGLNDCGLGTIRQSTTLVWSATGTCANSATFTLTIDRGFVTPQPPGIPVPGTAEGLQMIATHVTLSYPYSWHFNGIMQLVVPNATYAAISQIQTDAVAPNQN